MASPNVPPAAHRLLHCFVHHLASAFRPGCPALDLLPSAASAEVMQVESAKTQSSWGICHDINAAPTSTLLMPAWAKFWRTLPLEGAHACVQVVERNCVITEST